MGVIHHVRPYLRKLNVTSEDTCLCPDKDYSSHLGGKLTMFTFCKYKFVLPMSNDFWIVLTYFIVYGFCKNIRVMSANFVVYDLFCCLC
jgi:hypothetical protein